LHNPTRVRLDAEGNLFICDVQNSAIRRLGLDGVITTFAGSGAAGYSGDGGPAGQAVLNKPYDLRFAPNGDIYIADTGNHRIRRITPDGTITTVVGTGDKGFAGDLGDASTCQLDGPSGIIFDADGSLWIADFFNQRVRRVARFLEWVED